MVHFSQDNNVSSCLKAPRVLAGMTLKTLRMHMMQQLSTNHLTYCLFQLVLSLPFLYA